METLKKFMEALRTDPRAEELVKGKEKPESLEDAVRLYAEAAAALGFALTEEDISEGLKVLEEEQKAKTEQAKEAVKELDTADLEKVAGGIYVNTDCEDTFKQEENCWFNDGCDQVLNKYNNYICKRVEAVVV